jgi:hypothetical protein
MVQTRQVKKPLTAAASGWSVSLAEEAAVGRGQSNSQDPAVFQSKSERNADPAGGIVQRIEIDVAFEAVKAGNGKPGALDEPLVETDRVPDRPELVSI